MISDYVLHDIMLVCSDLRIKKEFKRGKPLCGRSVKEIIAAAGKRQLTHDNNDENDSEIDQPLSLGSPISPLIRNSHTRLGLDRSSIDGYLMSQENLLDFNNKSGSRVDGSPSYGRIPLNPGRRHRRGSKFSPLAHSSLDLLSSINNSPISLDFNENTQLSLNQSRSSPKSPNKINPSNSSGKISPLHGSGIFDLSSSQLNFSNVQQKEDDNQEDNGNLLSLNATRGTDLSATEIEFNLNKSLNKEAGADNNTPTFDQNDFSFESYEYYSEVSEEFQDKDDNKQEKKRRRRTPVNVFYTAEGQQLLQGKILSRGVFSDDEDNEEEPRTPILSRFMLPPPADEEREERRIAHREKFMEDSLLRESRFGRNSKSATRNNQFSQSYVSRSPLQAKPDSPSKRESTIVDSSSLYANSPRKESKITNCYLDVGNDNTENTPKRSKKKRSKESKYSGSSNALQKRKAHKFLSGDY